MKQWNLVLSILFHWIECRLFILRSNFCGQFVDIFAGHNLMWAGFPGLFCMMTLRHRNARSTSNQWIVTRNGRFGWLCKPRQAVKQTVLLTESCNTMAPIWCQCNVKGPDRRIAAVTIIWFSKYPLDIYKLWVELRIWPMDSLAASIWKSQLRASVACSHAAASAPFNHSKLIQWAFCRIIVKFQFDDIIGASRITSWGTFANIC